MSWRRWLADRIAPKVEKAAGQVEAAADEAKDRIVVAVQERTGMSRRLVLFLLVLTLLLGFAGGYAIIWHFSRPAKPPAELVPVQTQGRESVYQGNQVPAMAKAGKKGKAKPRIETRPVATVPVEDLPPEEQAKVPAVPPAAGPDNVVRPIAAVDTQVVPPSRGETYARAYLLPDGTVKIFQDPQRERFWGWAWKRIELEGKLGLIGNTQAKATGRWIPLRMGSFHVGAEGSVATEQNGTIRGEGMLMFRAEPFRDSYR